MLTYNVVVIAYIKEVDGQGLIDRTAELKTFSVCFVDKAKAIEYLNSLGGETK